MSNRLYSGLPDFARHKCWAEIDTDALIYNYKLLSSYLPNSCRRFAVVKADAYGHGVGAVVPALLSVGCRHFAVSCVEEAVNVREVCRKSIYNNEEEITILILGYTCPEQAKILSEYNITQAVPSFEYAVRLDKEARAFGVVVKVHIALDTGMNRIGLTAHNESEISTAISEAAAVSGMKGLCTTGMFTHFAEADDELSVACAEQSRVRTQFERYMAVVRGLDGLGLRPKLCHACNSAASVRFPEMYLDGVRLGIAMYGVRPSGYVELPLKPVMHLKTVISHIHRLLPGERVSYGGTFSAETERMIATLPVGYADGFIRKYSGASVRVSSENERYEAEIVGRICMDQCMIDVTGLPCKVGDEVTLFGDKPERLSRLSELAESIEYEAICLISARVPRVVGGERENESFAYESEGNI